MKIKNKPSEKIVRRYILLEGSGIGKDKIEKIILDYIGILGWSKASPVFVDLKGKQKDKLKGIVLAVARKELVNVRAAFELCEENIKVKKVSGTLKGLEK